MKKNSLFALAALILALPAWAFIQPLRINFQGKLMDPSTNLPKNGLFSMTFNIYNSPAGGTALYTESQSNITVTNGVFSVQIGTATALSRELFLGASAYLGVTVTGDPGGEMKPLQSLVMSPYAFTANQLSDEFDVRLIAGPTYSTFTSAGNLTVPGGLVASSGSFTNGITASSGTFTGDDLTVGVSSFVVIGSSVGIRTVSPAAALDVNGSAQFGQGVSKSTFDALGHLTLVANSDITLSGANGFITSRSSVNASAFFGDGAGLDDVTPDVYMSSSSRSPILVLNTEKPISYSTVTFNYSTTKAFIMGATVVSGTGALATGTLRLRVSAAGGACTIASTLIHAVRWGVPATASASAYPTIFALHAPGAAGTYTYCLTLLSTVANNYMDHELAVIQVSPVSTTVISP